MTATDITLRASYAESHALVVGINAYTSAPPLGYAVSDATAIAALLIDRFGFREENTRVLLDGDATREAIRKSFFAFSREGTGVNDRVLVFFAGHGHTVPSRRGDIGFLVPYDGDSDDLSSLIRWDELTRNADIVNAKHILFLMDACYGGLAITRALQPGSMRFLKDMLLRTARQVVTAGKANEVVADLGGPLPDHSVFTGHLLEGLSGKAAAADGVLTANGVMAYVYQNVGRDPSSRQTPHFGYLDGDGDFIFAAPILAEILKEEEQDRDVLISVPAVLFQGDNGGLMSVTEQAKDLLSEERHRIKLHELVSSEIRQVLSLTSEDQFPMTASWSPEEFAGRLFRYEQVTMTIRELEALLGYWGAAPHEGTLTLAPKRIASSLQPQSGLSAWISLRWYPVLLLLYSGGIAAIAAGQYDNLRALLHTNVGDPRRSGGATTALLTIYSELSDCIQLFKTLPGHERHYVPLSEYLFKLLQPSLDDLLFLGTDYETCFDYFEVLIALEHAEQHSRLPHGNVWGPVGRFAWKHRRDDASPFRRLVAEAEAKGNTWPPLQAGLFTGSIDRFKTIATEYEALLTKRGLGW
ncbi:MAG: caspase family protein [Acidobacteriota bacterium]